MSKVSAHEAGSITAKPAGDEDSRTPAGPADPPGSPPHRGSIAVGEGAAGGPQGHALPLGECDGRTFGEALAVSTRTSPPLAKAESTRIGEALSELRTRFAGRDLGAVVLISDGHARLRCCRTTQSKRS
jgi:hypothetical protein